MGPDSICYLPEVIYKKEASSKPEIKICDVTQLQELFHNPEVETNYSLSYINKVTNNDRTAVLKMIERFISVADKDAAKLESYIKSLNWAKALALIGDMKISFGRFKAEKVVKLLNELETETAQANKVNKARINGLLMEIRNAISELVMVLQNVQETTKSS